MLFFFPMKIKILPVQKKGNCARAKKVHMKKTEKPAKSTRDKANFPGFFSKIVPVQLQIVHVEKKSKCV